MIFPFHYFELNSLNNVCIVLLALYLFKVGIEVQNRLIPSSQGVKDPVPMNDGRIFPKGKFASRDQSAVFRIHLLNDLKKKEVFSVLSTKV